MKRRLAAEFLGTMFLLVIVVGSGIMGESLAQGNAAIALLANSLATGAGLFVLIQCLGPLSGAHFNPVVTFTELLWGRVDKKDLLPYWLAQVSGGVAGVMLAHAMFDQVLVQISHKDRLAPHLWLSEVVATFGLISTIGLAGKKHVEFAPLSVAAYIVAAYWFTSSTSFANPAVTVARMLTDTFCGISPAGVLPFIGAQFIGAAAAFLILLKADQTSKAAGFKS